MAENLDLVLRVRADLEAAIRQLDRLAEGADRLGTAFTRAGFSPPRHPPTPAVMSARGPRFRTALGAEPLPGNQGKSALTGSRSPITTPARAIDYPRDRGKPNPRVHSGRGLRIRAAATRPRCTAANPSCHNQRGRNPRPDPRRLKQVLRPARTPSRLLARCPRPYRPLHIAANSYERRGDRPFREC